MQIERYAPSRRALWDEFVITSKNGTFLFLRDYMDYHQDRFIDHSLLIWDEKGVLIAILPANSNENTLISHGGLTFGGFITSEKMKTSAMLAVFEHTLQYLQSQRLKKLIYKATPHIYHRIPAEEDLYALFRYGARLYRRDITTTVEPGLETAFQERRLRGIKKAKTANITCSESDDYGQFWSILEHNLVTAHNTKPVHSLAEILQLRSSFPANIKLFGAFLEREMVAGTIIYENQYIAHAQYIASLDNGRSLGALDLLFSYLIKDVFKNKKYFDFGISTESDGTYLNTGLIEFKEGFGGRGITHDFYEIVCQ